MKKVIIVDDSEVIRGQLRDVLAAAGHLVLEAEDGAGGLRVVHANPDASVVITDYNMPVMDGASMCEAIYRDVVGFVGKVVMLTTETDFTLKARGKKAGIKYWMTKPVSPDKLTQVIGKLVA